MYKYVRSSKMSFKNPKLDDTIKSALRVGIQGYLGSIGWDDSMIKDYTFIDVDHRPGYYDDGTDAIHVEVRAEVGYDDLIGLCDALDPIIAKFCSDAYFEPETSGIISAMLWED